MDITEYFLVFAIGILLTLMIAFLFRSNFKVIMFLLLNSFFALLLLMLTVFLGRTQHISHYFLCGGFGVLGYMFSFLPIFC